MNRTLTSREPGPPTHREHARLHRDTPPDVAFCARSLRLS